LYNLVPFVLEGRSVVSLDLAKLLPVRDIEEFELRFQRVLDEVLAQPNIIIFIDEIHNIGGLVQQKDHWMQYFKTCFISKWISMYWSNNKRISTN
jgi:ATP-dependent Clp protease ATP-binding subunit ClpA